MKCTAVITGASQGIGAATARRLVRDGWNVALLDIDPDVQNVARELGPGAHGYVGDVAAADDWERVVDAVHADLGPIDGLVSNALASVPAPIGEMTEDSWRRQLDVNLTGAFHAVRACLPDLVRNRSGRVVLVSSVHAFFGLPDVPAYATTKAGLTGLTRQLAVQYGSELRVNCVAPGPVRTAQWDRLSEDEVERSSASTVVGRIGHPDEVASAIAFLLGDDASFITGTTLMVDGGWSITKDSA